VCVCVCAGEREKGKRGRPGLRARFLMSASGGSRPPSAPAGMTSGGGDGVERSVRVDDPVREDLWRLCEACGMGGVRGDVFDALLGLARLDVTPTAIFQLVRAIGAAKKQQAEDRAATSTSAG